MEGNSLNFIAKVIRNDEALKEFLDLCKQYMDAKCSYLSCGFWPVQ